MCSEDTNATELSELEIRLAVRTFSFQRKVWGTVFLIFLPSTFAFFAESAPANESARRFIGAELPAGLSKGGSSSSSSLDSDSENSRAGIGGKGFVFVGEPSESENDRKYVSKISETISSD